MKKKLAILYIKYSRGQGHLNVGIELIKTAIYFGGAQFFLQKWFDIVIPNWTVFVLVIIYPALCIILGHVDERYGIWKMQNDYTAKELTPFFKDMRDKIDLLSSKP